MEIRRITSEDREEVFLMMRVFFDSEVVLHKAEDAVLYRAIDDALSGIPFIECFVFEEEKSLSGYAMVAKSYSTEYGGICLWIEDLYIKPECRGQGIGTKFFRFIEKEYHGEAVRYKLEVEEENERAMSVYKNCGYDKLGYMVMSKEME